MNKSVLYDFLGFFVFKSSSLHIRLFRESLTTKNCGDILIWMFSKKEKEHESIHTLNSAFSAFYMNLFFSSPGARKNIAH